MIRDFGATSGAYNSATAGDKAEGVICDVSNCYYNRDKKYCTAGQIKVGPVNATCTDDTVCATFRPQ